MTTRLTGEEIKKELANLSGWSLRSDKLYKQFIFSDFDAAFRFMTSVADSSERMHHHPEWTNVYNKVDVYLTTHDVGGISEKDFALAKEMDRFA